MKMENTVLDAKTNVGIKNGSKVDYLLSELKNFQDIARHIKPLSGEIPQINGIDIYGEVIPFNGIVGGDHIIYVDFNKRYDLDHRIQEAQKQNRQDIVEKLELNKRRAGVLVADAAGHNITDALLSAMLHQAFLTGVQYELKDNGEVTADLFEILNTRFFNSSSITKFITLIYGEIWDNGHFRFVNAGHPPPVVFSNKYDKLIKVCYEQVIHFPPIGTMPSREDVDSRRHFSHLGYKKKYSVHSINLMGEGDILLLYTDGLSEHCDEKNCLYFAERLEDTLKRIKNESASDIYAQIKENLLSFAEPSDDITFVVIKKV
ncbi:MAG: SpoIIE family protein phosphatase [Candidatus Aminicenantes bacterium]|nr:SpoIIE family protein phosphatase [Candidatus Aminicenantes bacterium]NIQ65888.1 SpoIIE family protein phosphatase [Candidatus Aminicenantes bacterium]NIT21875.1 SpoIIE family protein phosphatase [Candidatus Aminicenantes bacterium]